MTKLDYAFGWTPAMEARCQARATREAERITELERQLAEAHEAMRIYKARAKIRKAKAAEKRKRLAAERKAESALLRSLAMKNRREQVF